MTFTEEIVRLAAQVRIRREQVHGEEAVKQALILPFFVAMGYDVYDPAQVRPEYTADFAVKKAGQLEKVDYALCANNQPFLFLEAKTSAKPRVHDGQLQRYFNATPSVKVAVISNGLEYRFFTDLKHANMMDPEPFFTFNLLEYEEKDLEILQIFHQSSYQPDLVRELASQKLHLEAMKKRVGEILRDPPDSFIRYLLGEVGYEGRITSKVISNAQPTIKRAIQASLVEFMARSIDQQITAPAPPAPVVEALPALLETEEETSRELSAEESEFFERVQRMLSKCEPQREVYCKTASSYFAVHLGKSSSWFIRFVLNSRRKSMIVRLEPDEVLALSGSFEVLTVSEGMGTCQVLLNGQSDLPFLRPLIVRCYEAAVNR